MQENQSNHGKCICNQVEKMQDFLDRTFYFKIRHQSKRAKRIKKKKTLKFCF